MLMYRKENEELMDGCNWITVKNKKEYEQIKNCMIDFGYREFETSQYYEKGMCRFVIYVGWDAFGFGNVHDLDSYNEVSFDDIFVRESTFKTEAEMIQWTIDNKMAIKYNSEEEYVCLMTLLDRVGIKACGGDDIESVGDIEIETMNCVCIDYWMSRELEKRGATWAEDWFYKNKGFEIVDFEDLYERLE